MTKSARAKHGKHVALTQVDRQSRVAELYLEGSGQVAIAEALGISQSTVSRDIESIKDAWQQSSLVNFNEAVRRELTEIELLEREYYQSWFDSKRATVIKEAEQFKRDGKREDGKPKQGTRRVLHRRELQPTGDPRFLRGVEWCIEQRCKLLGLVTKKVALEDWRSAAVADGIDPDALKAEMVAKALEMLEQSDTEDII